MVFLWHVVVRILDGGIGPHVLGYFRIHRQKVGENFNEGVDVTREEVLDVMEIFLQGLHDLLIAELINVVLTVPNQIDVTALEIAINFSCQFFHLNGLPRYVANCHISHLC